MLFVMSYHELKSQENIVVVVLPLVFKKERKSNRFCYSKWEMLGEQMLAWRWHKLLDLIANWYADVS